jgi:hypothetical protein
LGSDKSGVGSAWSKSPMRKVRAVVAVSSVSAEFEDAELGDARLTQRLLKLAEAVSGGPEQSLPLLAASESELVNAEA